MKRFYFLSSLLLILAPCNAEKIKVDIKSSSQNSTARPIRRTPLRLPIDVVFDNETMTIEVSCASDLEGEVYVYNASEELEDYSPCLNSILSVSNSDYHTILIEGDGWSATGMIE